MTPIYYVSLPSQKVVQIQHLEYEAFRRNGWVAKLPGREVFFWISKITPEEARDILDVDQRYQSAIADETLDYVRRRNKSRRESPKKKRSLPAKL
jgi:hypothetical protein